MQKVKSSLEEKSDEYVGLLAALNNTSLNRPPQAFSGLCSSLSFSPSSQGFIGTCTPIAVSACPLARLTRQVWNVPRTLGDSDRAFTRKKKVRLEGNNWPDPTVSQPKLFSFSLYKMQSSFQGLASQRNYAFFLSKTREAITTTSHHPPLCYQSSLFTRENQIHQLAQCIFKQSKACGQSRYLMYFPYLEFSKYWVRLCFQAVIFLQFLFISDVLKPCSIIPNNSVTVLIIRAYSGENNLQITQ